MTNKDKRHEDAADLRERAEEKFRADDAKTKKKLTPPVGRRSEAPAGVDFQGALKETRKMLHELRVHQIELEMQNENLRRTQAELDAARARYFDLYDLAPVGYCTVSEQGLILEANLTAAKLLGWERKQLVKQPLTSFILNEDQDVYYLHRKQLFESGAPQVCELRMLNKEGNHFWARLEAAVAQDADGALVGRVVLSDITERKQVESQKNAALEALQRSEENFRLSLEDSPLGVRIATAKGETIYANKVFLDLYGYESIDEFNGIPIKERYTPQSYAESQLRKKVRDQGDFGPSVYEINIVRKNKEIRHLLVLRKKVLWDGTEQFQAIYQDISERKRVEAALRESEERYRAIVDTSRDCVFITSVAGRWLYMNDAAVELFDYSSREELSQVNIPDLYANSEERVKCINIIIERGYFKEFPVDLLRKDSTIINALITAVPRYGADGNVTGFQGTIRDITERKLAEEVIRSSLAEKEVLLKEVHHRVKNNLMTIIGLINMQETKANNKMFNPLLQELEGRIRSMALVHESLHKAEDLAHVNLQNYIETMSAHIRAQFGAERDIRFRVQAAGVDVNLDIAVPCGLILNELITNAYKHAFPKDKPRAGEGNCEINVIVNQEGGMNLLTVADNGVGLPADLDWEKSEALGLRLIKMLSKQINGSIELDRSAGTVFRLKFPVAV